MNNRQNQIYYWRGASAISSKLAEYGEVIARLLKGDYNKNDLEKLPHYNLYSFRLNISDRLIFSTQLIDGEPHLLLLEAVLNHDYQKSRFLKPSVLRQFLEIHENNFYEFNEKDWTELSEQEQKEFPSADGEIQLSPVDFFNQKAIQFDTDQEKALSAKLPHLISGSAGSGKTCVAISSLAQLAAAFSGNERKQLLYVTQSDALCAYTQRIWRQHPASQHLNNVVVEFKTIQQLMTELDEELKGLTLSTCEDFYEWLKDDIKAQIKKTKVDLSFTKRTEELYQEFRRLMGFSQKDYLDSGKKQSLFQSKEQKEWIWNCCYRYILYLKTIKKVDLALHHIEKLKAIFDAIVVDEAQDLSLAQLNLLLKLAINYQTLFCMDTLQSLSDQMSQRPYIAYRLHQVNHEPSHTELSISYRCKENPGLLAKAIMDIRNFHLQGTADKLEQRGIISINKGNDKGSVQWVEATSEGIKSLNLGDLNADIAILSEEQYKEEAKKYFNTPLIFTPEECKGLEYKTVILYRPFDLPIFNESNANLKGLSLENLQGNQHRPKEDAGDPKFAPPYHRVYTMVTRNLDRVIVCQTPFRGVNNICQILKSANKNQKNTNVTSATSSSTDWLMEAKNLLLNNKTSQARDIFLTKLNKTEDDFNHFREVHTPNSHDIAPKPNFTIDPAIIESAVRAKMPDISKLNNILSEINTTTPYPLKFFNEPVRDVVNTPSRQEICLNYIKQLLTDKMFTKESIKKLLLNKNINDILFNTKLENSNNLFIEIMKNKKYLPIFILAIQSNPDLAKNINVNFLFCAPSWHQPDSLLALPIFWMTRSETAHDLLGIFSGNRNFLNLFSADLLCKTTSTNDPSLKDESLLLHLTSFSQEGFLFLNTLLSLHSDIIREITPESFTRAPLLSKHPLFLRSPFYNLCQVSQVEQGMDLFNLILKLNYDLISTLTSNDLFNLAIFAKSKNGNYTQPLHWLALNEYKHHLIEFLLKENPTLLVNHLTTEMISTIHDTGEGKSSIFQCLEGMKALDIILSRNPNIKLEEIPSTASTHVSGDIQSDLNLANKITHIISSRERLSETELNDFITSLVTPACYSLLLDYFKKNPHCIAKLPPELLCGTTESYNPSNPPPFYKLLRLNNNPSLLPIFMDHHPELMSYFTADILCRPYSSHDSIIKDDCLFYLLLQHPQYGLPFLFDLVQRNPEIVKHIPPNAICRKVIGAPAPYVSILYALAALVNLDMGSALFHQLIKDNPDIMHAITPEAFLSGTFTDPALSPFFLLALSEKGHTILLSILMSNPTLKLHITDKILHLKSKEYKLSAQDFLYRTTNGKTLLNFLRPSQVGGLQINARNVHIETGPTVKKTFKK